MARLVLSACCILQLALLAGACAKARAEAAPAGPPLRVPEAPARVLAPVEEPLVATPAAVPETPAPAAEARTPPRRPAEPRPQAARPAPPAEKPAQPRELRAAPSPATGVTERSVRDVLARAARDLGRVDYGRLTADGRATYEQSKRFSQQAERALSDRNVVFAATLAEKAATLAAELVGR